MLDIIGDAILAFFPAGDNGGTEACSLALEAAAGARERLAELKREGSGKARAIEFGIGVHFGDVVFGNAGTPERLKFGVLGRAVNEVARTADMAKSLKRPVVVSDGWRGAAPIRSPTLPAGSAASASAAAVGDGGELALK